MFNITFPLVLLGLTVLFITKYSIWLIQALYKRIKYGVLGDKQAARIPALNAPLPTHKIDREALSGVTIIGSASEGKSKDENVADVAQQKVEMVYRQSGASTGGLSLKGMPLSNLSHLESYPSHVFKEHPSNYMLMGLRKLDTGNWLTIDSEYD